MILKHYSRLRHSFPLHSYATSKRLAKPQENAPVKAFKEVDRRLSDYLFFKYDVNQQIEYELTELRKSAQLIIKKTPPEIITSMHRILLEIPMEAIAESNMKIIKDLITIIKDKKASQQTSGIYNQVERRIFGLDNSNENFNNLFRVYRISQSNQKSIRNQRAQIILKNLTYVKLSVEEISLFFQKLCDVNVLTPIQQQIRLNLLKRIRHTIPEISIKLLSNVGRHLNALSHYDFIPEQLEIVQEIFKKMAQREQEMTEGMIQQIFKGNQYPSNFINLSQFYSKIIFSKLQGIKRHNSAEAHKLFHFIGLANSKILPALNQNDENSYNYFILRYCQVNGKTQKHFQTTIDIFLTIINEIFNRFLVIHPSYSQRCNEMIKECKVSPNVPLLYNLAKFEIFRSYIFDNFKELSVSPAQNQKIVLALVAKMIGMRQMDTMWQQFFEKYFLNPQAFIQLIGQMQETSIPCIFQSFHTIFQEQISRLMSDIELNALGLQGQKRLLRYFINSQSLRQVPFSQTIDDFNQSLSSRNKGLMRENLLKFSIDIIEDNVQTRLKDPSNRQIERYLQAVELLILAKGQQKKDILAINLLQRINVRFRQNSFSLSKILRYKRLFQLVTSKSDYFLSQQGLVQSLYSDLIRKFLINYNNDHNQYRLTGFFVAIIGCLVQKLTFFDCDLSTKHLIIKQGLNCSLIANKNVNGIGIMDESCFTFIEIQKIKYFRYFKHQTIIDEITHQTLPLIILNNNLHHYLESHKAIISDLIASATPSQFQKIIRQFCYYSQPLSPVAFDLFLKIMKQFPTKIQISTIQRYVLFNNFCLKYYIHFEQLQKVVLLWMKYFLTKRQTLEDFQTHIVILKLMKSLKFKQITVSFQMMSNNYPNRYLHYLLDKYSNHHQEQEKILYYLLFTNFRFHEGHERNTFYQTNRGKLEKFLTFSNPEVVLTSLLYLQLNFKFQQRLILLKKIMDIARNQLKKEGGVNILTYYQYGYLKKTYKENTQNFDIPEKYLSKAPFSTATPQAVHLLMSASRFLKQNLTKIELHENEIYKMRSNYIIFLPVDKQSSRHEFAYLERLMKCLFGEDILVTIVQRIENSSYIPLNKVFKLHPLMNNQEWTQYYKWVKSDQEKHSEGKMAKENSGASAKIAHHKLSYIQQLKLRKTMMMKNKLKK